MTTTPGVARSSDAIPGITYRTTDYWARAGLLHLGCPGSGNRRDYSDDERRAARALDSLRRLGGVDPSEVWRTNSSAATHGATRALQHTVAELARNSQPGTVHHIASPCPWVRHVLIVPDP